MTHRFGGRWTEEKLEALRKYLSFFPKALASKFDLVYIDTFAGSGKCTIKHGVNGERTIEGSALIALQQPFHRYFFIEQRKRHVQALQELRAQFAERTVEIIHGDARENLSGVLASIPWKHTRGVLFLDPYGLQCTWEMVKEIAATKALDIFFLVSISGLTRQAARDASNIDGDKAAALDSFLGTPDWRTALYSPPPQADMFISSPSHVRETGVESILEFVKNRMGSEFAHVEEPLILRGPNNAVLYALFFAVANDSPKAVGLAKKVVGDILKGLR